MRRGSALVGVLAGLAVCIFGFGAFCLLWYFGTWPTNVPGLWDYRSATIGDGVLLPLTIGLLAVAGSNSVRTNRQRKLIWTATVLGVIIGTSIQMTWLLNPHPPLNWGMPSPSKLNLAGAYHAAFFVLVSGAGSGLAVRMLLRLRELRETSPAELHQVLESPAAALLVTCSAGFVGLVVLDGHSFERYGGENTVTSLSATISAILLMLLVITLLIVSLGTAAARSTWKMFAWGTVAAVSLTLLAWRPRHYIGGLDLDEFAFIICFSVLFVVQLWVWREQSAFWWLAAVTVVLIAIAGAGYALVDAGHNVAFAAGAAIVTLVLVRLVLIAPTVHRELRRHLLGTLSAEDVSRRI